MAVRLEFINLLVPIEKIDTHYPGGFKQFCEDNRRMLGGRLWHDDHLLRDGAMNPRDMEEAVQFWSRHGLIAFEERDGTKHWRDMCVVEELAGGPTLPCDWIVVDSTDRAAYHKEFEKGKVIGREEAQAQYRND